VRVLLDTHTFVWAHLAPERLGSQRGLVERGRNDLLVSAASSWEIAIKVGLGRLELPEPPARWMPTRITALGASPLAVEHAHALAVADLPPVHKDPFDRLLVAQATVLGVPILSADAVFDRYDVEWLAIE
jgi:PIN domain nuclease of toxin-antitoxin system